jgi:putative zinc finger protein
MTLSSHPEELLAEYADGTLGPEDRARVDAHVATCPTCREEIVLAGSSRQVLEALPQLDVPPGTMWPVVQRAGRRRRWLPAMSPRAAWVTAGAAAAAAAVIGAFALVGGLDLSGSPQSAAGRAEMTEGAAGPQPSPNSQFDTAAEGADYPVFQRSSRDYDAASLNALTAQLTRSAKGALDQGFPEPPLEYHRRVLLAKLPAQTRQSLTCVVRAVSPDRSLAPYSVLITTYDGEPVYVGAFLQADEPNRPYRQLVLYVVSRQDCTLKSFARQQL